MDTSSLNENQKKAVLAPHEPLLIVAGAGTGKTKTLTSRILALIEGGIPQDAICALTFTNKAAKEMADRLRTYGLRLGKTPWSFAGTDPYIGTFHALGAKILRREAQALGRTPRFVIFDDHDSFQLMKNILKKSDEGKKKENTPGKFLGIISNIKNGSASFQDLDRSTRLEDVIASTFFHSYERKLRENNAFDFDDLIYKTVALFKANAAIRTRYEDRFRYLLVDEYQDLNNMQYELVRLLADRSKNITVVGDDQQTIYSWRGSNFEIFLNFEKDWPKSQVVLLEQNYRSTKNIIEAAGAVIKNNLRQKQKTLWTENPEGSPVKLVEVADEDEEAQWIGEEIANSNERIAGTTERFAPSSLLSTAVLYRTNAQSRPVEQALIERNIPYIIFGGLKFYERREIKDIVAGLRFAINPNDEISRERLTKTFSKTKFRELEERFAESIASPLDAINIFLKTTDYLAYAEKNLTNPQDRRENIGELIRFATQFETLDELVEQISLLQATDQVDSETGPPPVSLMTIHLAKGLEFDRVFVAGCAEGVLPHVRSFETEAGLEEERRLMYVAMTRAKKDLALSFYDLPSRFLSEIPQELMQFKSFVSNEEAFQDGEERYITLD